MILNDTPQHEAIMSNVGEIGEFRIRNSAKAFSILSSGLYANKIKAIIRELSCNAVDSHAAAGKKDVPFDVHLPTALEPWFAIRDYGTGLSHDQVTQIYTTYFESTKTNSNEFIGALGLGSKSPFSYTDNFTVTAVQNGVKGIYSAFINASGVPSIAKMMDEETAEPNGVEVKFSVNDRWDFDKFRQEARSVYTWFKLQPVITGDASFTITQIEYETVDIIPGVSSRKDCHRASVALMGNIAYPIDIPQSDNTLAELSNLLRCGLVMEFSIGELDFQASREGLSYIPQTIASIKRKLEAVNAVLASHVTTEADAIVNMWDRALFLQGKKDHPLWHAAVVKYVTDTAFPLIKIDRNYVMLKSPSFEVEKLKSEYNVVIRAFERYRGNNVCATLRSYREQSTSKNTAGVYEYTEMQDITVSVGTRIVFNDTKVGALERAKFHFRQNTVDRHNAVYVVDAYDKTLPIKRDEFLKAMQTPPDTAVLSASALAERERSTGGVVGKNVTIMQLQEKGYGGYYRQRDLVWRDAGKATSFDPKTKVYYMPLSGYNLESAFGLTDIKELATDLKDCGIPDLNIDRIYGVRKGDIEFIQTQKNWINLETFIVKNLAKIDAKIVNKFIRSELDNYTFINYNSTIVKAIDPASPITKIVTEFKDISNNTKVDRYSIARLIKRYSPKTTFDPNAALDKYKSECDKIDNRYPLLSHIRHAEDAAVAEYINLIDKTKGI